MSLTSQILAPTVVGTVGAANQLFAGRNYTLAELQAYFTAPKVISYYQFANGALETDAVGTYDYTLGAAAKEPSNGTGIVGTAHAISFDGGDYATNATKFDDMTTTFSGAGKGLIHSFWVSAPADGQPAAVSFIFHKTNSAANDKYRIYLNSTGVITISTNGNSATLKDILASTILPNGANTIWLHCVVAWNTTRGLELYINGRREAQDTTATTLMVDGTTTDFYFSGSDTTPANPFTGIIANEAVINDVCTQAMVDFLYATTLPLPTALQGGKNFTTECFMKPSATGSTRQVFCDEVIRTSTDLLVSGGTRRSTDYYKINGTY